VTRERIRPYDKTFAQKVKIKIRSLLIEFRLWYLRNVYKMDLGQGVSLSLRADLDWTNPRGVHIGDQTYVAFGAVILAHDMSRLLHTHTYIGKRCFIGAHAIILPGVRIGDECVVGAGAVVTKDVPSGSIVSGNPAVVIRSGVKTGKWGKRREPNEGADAAPVADEPPPPVAGLADM
jgi:acetyltransferase-like isoleucine patch superfamily enzyme